MAEPFRVDLVPGVVPDRWARAWAARTADRLELTRVPLEEQTARLRAGLSHMAFVRLPVDRADLHVISLYTEVTVVVAAADHAVAAFEEVDVGDLAGEHLLQDPAEVPGWPTDARAGRPPMTTAQAVEVAASGAGVLVLPLSLARLHHRKDLVHRPLTGVPGSEVGLVWLRDQPDERVETFVGIVRGRTANSSRDAERAGSAQGRAADGRDGGAGSPAGRTPRTGRAPRAGGTPRRGGRRGRQGPRR